MGVKCQIIRNAESGQVAKVLNSEGDESKLYHAALMHTKGKKNQALNLWTVAYLDGFPIKDREATLEEVFNYATLKDVKIATLTQEEVVDFKRSILNTPISNLAELDAVLRSTFYTNGEYTIDEKKLRASNLYSESEVINILKSTVTQEKIRTSINNLTGHVLKNPNVEESSKEKNTLDFEAVDNSKVNLIGKFESIPTQDVYTTLDEQLAGVKTETEFITKVRRLPFYDVADKILSTPENITKYFNIYSNKSVLKSFVATEEGKVPKQKNNTEEQLMQTIVLGKDSAKIQDSISIIESIPEQVWIASNEDVTKLLKEIERETVSLGIDIVGLTEVAKTRTQEEIVSFLSGLKALAENLSFNLVEEQDVSNFATESDTFFNVDNSQKNAYERVSESNKSRAIVQVDTKLDEVQMYDKFGLIKVDEGIYHQVLKPVSMEAMYQEVYETVLEDNTILPKEAYYPSGVDENNNIDITELNNPSNRVNVQRDIRKFIQSTALASETLETDSANTALEELTLYKQIFKHKTVKQATPQATNEVVKYKQFKGDEKYLQGWFVNDFNSYIVSEKYNNSKLYNNVLKYFDITSSGIVFVGNDVNTIDALRDYTTDNVVLENLKQYTILSKNPSLDGLYEFEELSMGELINMESDMRIYYGNNSNAVEVYKGDYSVVNGKITLDGLNADYIRVAEGVFARVQSHLGKSYYTQMPSNPSNYNVLTEIELDTNIEKFEVDNLKGTKEGVTQTNLYSEEELKQINEEIDECGQ